MDMKEIWDKQKKAIIGGACVLALLLAWVVPGLFGGGIGPLPEPSQAAPAEVLRPLSNPRFREQSDSVKLEYGTKVFNYISASPDRLAQYAQMVESLPESQADELRENVVEIAKVQVAEDSRTFSTLRTPSEQRKFIDSRVKQWKGVQSMATGRSGGAGGQAGGARGPSFASKKMTKGLSGDPAQAYKTLLDKTSPGERAKMEKYIGAVQGRMDQLRSINKGRSGQ